MVARFRRLAFFLGLAPVGALLLRGQFQPKAVRPPPSALPSHEQTPPSVAAFNLRGVAHGGGIFGAVGNGGSLVTSVDGRAWSQQTTDITEDLFAATYGASSFVAVGQTGIILTSGDGRTWSHQIVGDMDDLRAVTYGDGSFLALLDTHAAIGQDSFLTSADGGTWSLLLH